MNCAYAFIDDEARHLYSIGKDLEHRACRSIIKVLMQIDGVLSVAFAGNRVKAISDPEKPKPFLNRLQRAVFREGNIVFEDLVGKYKNDSFASGTQIISQNTNPIQQGNPDPVTAETGTLGHFVSTVIDGEAEEEAEEVGEVQWAQLLRRGEPTPYPYPHGARRRGPSGYEAG